MLRTIDWRRVGLAAGLGVLAFIAVLVTLPDYGLTWDEGKFLQTGERYRWWLRGVWVGDFSPFAAEPLAYAWLHTWDHPPLSRLLSVATVVATRTVLDPIAGQRLRSALLLALTVATGTWWLARRYSLTAGLAGGWAILCLPRLFGDAHLATTDMPLACFWLLTALAFQHEWEGRRQPWLTMCGLALLLLTKNTAVLILLAFVPFVFTDLRRGLRFLALALGGALLCYPLLQPQLWLEPAAILCHSMSYFVNRQTAQPIPVLFFGELFPYRAGWHYGFTMLILTTPLPVLAALLAGVATVVRRRERAGGHLILHLCLLPAVMAVPFVPTYDGVRLMLPALPFAGMLAGLGMHRLLAPLALRRRVLLLAAWLAVTALPLWQFAPRFHLSYYNELIGGLPGAMAAGMDTTYYGEVFGPRELAWLNKNLPAGARVNLSIISPWVMDYYKAHNLLRGDVQWKQDTLLMRGGRVQGADFMLLHYRWSFIRRDEQTARSTLFPLLTRTPVFSVSHQGVPLLALFDLREGG